ncbi:MAG: creatininase family protein [Deltaproteobacteria bacterium]|nr:creatininase family protein [Deltaproteobacteria bacterium]
MTRPWSITPGDRDGRVHRYETLTQADVLALDRDKTVVIATFSPLEVHGGHLPLGQDVFEADALAVAVARGLVARRPEWSVLLLPPYAVAADCVPLPGSVAFTPKQLAKTAYEALAPFARMKFARLAYSSFHGGPRHMVALEVASERLTRKLGTPTISLFSVMLARFGQNEMLDRAVAEVPDARIRPDELHQDFHGGYIETSLALHLYPELVHESWKALGPIVPEHRAKEGQGEGFMGAGEETSLLQKLLSTPDILRSMFGELRHFKQHGLYGYPGYADAEHGRKIFEFLTRETGVIVDEFIEKGAAFKARSPMWPLRHIMMNSVTSLIVDGWVMRPNEADIHKPGNG